MNQRDQCAERPLPLFFLPVVLALLATSLANAGEPEESTPSRLESKGVELHYIDTGYGEPIVFVHGGLADYRELAPRELRGIFAGNAITSGNELRIRQKFTDAPPDQ